MGNETSNELRENRRHPRSDAATLLDDLARMQSNENWRHFNKSDPATTTQLKLDSKHEFKKPKTSNSFSSDCLQTTVFDFLTADAVTTKDLDDHGPKIKSAIERVICLMHSEEGNSYVEYKNKRRQKEENYVKKDEKDDISSTGHQGFKGTDDSSTWFDARSYQNALLEIAKERNTIVHLRTGTGKTLIALLLIRHFYEKQTKRGKQIVFLVPSVALAIQHHSTITANLPYHVGLAYGGLTQERQEYRDQLSKCDVLVLTHGVCKALLSHYGDLFSVDNWELLILDECHNCVGNSPYALIMEQFYHKTAPTKRPRVLGLTASPLIAIKKGCIDQMQQDLTRLETCLDSTIISVESWVGPEGEAYRRRFLGNEADEILIYHDDTLHSPKKTWPQMEQFEMHEGRHRDFRQLFDLFNDVGPYVMALYLRQLVQELTSPNAYEGETEYLLVHARQYLRLLITFCEPYGFTLSNKVLQLEKLLNQQLNDGSVGVVFVRRRITALALNLYFAKSAEGDPHQRQVMNSLHMSKEGETEMSSGLENSNSGDQFGDAAIDEDPSFIIDVTPPSCMTISQHEREFASPRTAKHNISIPKSAQIKAGVLARNPKQLFKSLSTSGNEADAKYWVHQKCDIWKVISRLRSGEINVLIATAVVEEGIDVQACSFVVVFDGLHSLKSYIQMKGRVRQEQAKFFVFQGRHHNSSPLTLNDAQALEMRLQCFLASRSVPFEQLPRFPAPHNLDVCLDCETLDEEMEAVRKGFYKAKNGTLSLQSAKALLFRFALCQPMDPVVRCSKAALQAHLPLYDSACRVLHLPAFIEPSLRIVRLPAFCLVKSMKEMESMLALMACVRLHKTGLLSERLLPLTPACIQQQIMSVIENCVNNFKPQVCCPIPLSSMQVGTVMSMYQYTIILKGEGLDQARHALKIDDSHFVLLTNRPLENIPIFEHHHTELGLLSCSLGTAKYTVLMNEHVALVSEFFAMLMNARWKRRYQDAFFRPNLQSHKIGMIIGLLGKDGELDIGGMMTLLRESQRSPEQRRAYAHSLPHGRLREPRLWCPIYAEGIVYIVYGLSGDKTADSNFPANKLGEKAYKTYREFYSKCWEKEVPGESPLYVCQRAWKQPRSSLSYPSIKKQLDKHFVNGYTLCQNLETVFLPKELCMEAQYLARTGIALETVVLPQFLYFLERRMVAKAFTEYSSCNFPELGKHLKNVRLESIIELMSAQSCAEVASYERLEWLGDAVLKLVQTDAVLHSTDLQKWITNLHEGDLSSVRTVLCSNSHLAKVCDATGIDRFILTKKLEKGLYVPSGVHLVSKRGEMVNTDTLPSEKVRADFIESILALVHLECGYTCARKVADELQVTIPSSKLKPEGAEMHDQSRTLYLLDQTKAITEYTDFHNPRLLQQAFTHPTSTCKTSSSYQRLEWVGDAVLCLAVREYIYNNYPNAEVGKMVLMETPLVANSSLAFLSFVHGWHKLMDHRDCTLPGRIESYAFSVLELNKGQFSSDPPKCMADIVESLIGAIYIDGGWVAGRKAALKILAPIVNLYRASHSPEDFCFHPKMKLLELGGDLISLSTVPDRISGDVLARILCLDVELASIADVSRPAAIDRCSSLVLSTFEKNPSLRNAFISARKHMLSTAATMQKKRHKCSESEATRERITKANKGERPMGIE